MTSKDIDRLVRWSVDSDLQQFSEANSPYVSGLYALPAASAAQSFQIKKNGKSYNLGWVLEANGSLQPYRISEQNPNPDQGIDINSLPP